MIRVPKSRRDPLLDFLTEFEELLPPIFPSMFKEVIKIKCPGCRSILSIEVPEVFESESYAFYSNCNALIRIIWV